MKIGFNPQSIVGLDGMPLVGRVTFYVHDSDIKATVYSMQGDAFVESQNPQLLNNAGRLDDTVFFDAAIIDVSICPCNRILRKRRQPCPFLRLGRAVLEYCRRRLCRSVELD